MIVVGCGGRHFRPSVELLEYMRWSLEAARVEAMIHGGQDGADAAWEQAADMCQDVEVIVVKARWSRGPSAGPRRNRRTLQIAMGSRQPFEVWALPGGDGTADMRTRAENLGITVREFAADTRLCHGKALLDEVRGQTDLFHREAFERTMQKHKEDTED